MWEILSLEFRLSKDVFEAILMRYFIFSRQQWPSLQVWYNNNLSLIHLGLKKPALATLYCEKAVKQYDEDYKQAGEGVGKKKNFLVQLWIL